MTTYDDKLQEEAELWGSVAEELAQTTPPDWRYHRDLRHNVIMHAATIEALLARVQPNMRVLELGCASGWLTLAMAQRGAQATGYDISEKSLNVARAYYDSIKDEVSGSAEYHYADLNNLQLEPSSYDIIAVKGTLHHLVSMRHVIEEVQRALKPDGLFWIRDIVDDEHPRTVLFASGLMFLLPTQVSYGEKFKGLLKFGLKSPSRIKASMEAEGLSPFEGAGRDHDWLAIVREVFKIEAEEIAPAVTGYLTAQLKLPDSAAIPLLKSLRAVDNVMVKAGLLKSSGLTVYARK